MVDKLAPEGRHSVVHGDRVVYQWSQTVRDVDIFVPLPSGQNVSAKLVFVNMKKSEIDFGLVGADPYMKVWLALCAGALCRMMGRLHVPPAAPAVHSTEILHPTATNSMAPCIPPIQWLIHRRGRCFQMSSSQSQHG